MPTTNIFIGTILAILFTIAEEILCDTDSITTSQFIGSLAERLVSHQERLCFLLSCKFITVLHSPLPVTCLLLKIKCKSWGTSDGLQSLKMEFHKRKSMKADMATESIVNWKMSFNKKETHIGFKLPCRQPCLWKLVNLQQQCTVWHHGSYLTQLLIWIILLHSCLCTTFWTVHHPHLDTGLLQLKGLEFV